MNFPVAKIFKCAVFFFTKVVKCSKKWVKLTINCQNMNAEFFKCVTSLNKNMLLFHKTLAKLDKIVLARMPKIFMPG